MSANEYVTINGVRYAAVALTGTTDPAGNPAGNVVVSGGVSFTPSDYSATVTVVAGTASTGAIATGASKIMFANTSATTVDALVAFGTSAADATTNLAIGGGVGTTGYWIPAAVDSAAGVVTLGVPSSATHYAIVNDAGVETPTVRVIQGV